MLGNSLSIQGFKMIDGDLVAHMKLLSKNDIPEEIEIYNNTTNAICIYTRYKPDHFIYNRYAEFTLIYQPIGFQRMNRTFNTNQKSLTGFNGKGMIYLSQMPNVIFTYNP